MTDSRLIATATEKMEFFQRLEKIKTDFENGDTPPHIVEVLRKHVESLIASDAGKNVLAVGEIASLKTPVHAADGSKRLDSCFGDRSLVITWFRGNW